MDSKNGKNNLLTKNPTVISEIYHKVEVNFQDNTKEVLFINLQVVELSRDLTEQVIEALQEMGYWTNLKSAKTYKEKDGYITETCPIKT